MEQGMIILSSSALALGAFHTVAGPDHYLPFVALSQTRKWGTAKTLWIVTVCGLGHVLGTILLAGLFIYLGYTADDFKFFESQRGSIASWVLFTAGIVYTIWAVYHLLMNKAKAHSHDKLLGDKKKSVTFWWLFIIFVLGPCEYMIGILYAASGHGTISLVWVSILFALATISTMIVMTLLMLKGINLVKFHKLEKYQHVLAGFTLVLCGAGIIFLGL